MELLYFINEAEAQRKEGKLMKAETELVQSSLNTGGVQYQLTGPNRPLFNDSKKAFLKETKKRITVGL